MRAAPALFLAALCLTLASPGRADHGREDAHEDGRHDHDEVRRARESDSILPFSDLRPRIEACFGGRIIRLEYDRDDGRPTYEAVVLTPDGRLREIHIDAATGAMRDDGEDDHRRPRGDRHDRRSGDRHAPDAVPAATPTPGLAAAPTPAAPATAPPGGTPAPGITTASPALTPTPDPDPCAP